MESNRKDSELLARAERLVITTGVGDTGERLCRLNMRYGLAKMHYYQMSRGLEPDAMFLGAPDATVTRNPGRWTSGFGYGGLLRWSGDFVPLEAKPNGCGLLMVGLRREPTRSALVDRLIQLERSGLSLEGQTVSVDIRHSNHFLEVCRLSAEAKDHIDWDGPVALLHSSGTEFRGETSFGPGLYWDDSEALRAMATRQETPWGDIWVVEGRAAHDYERECHRVHRFQTKRRLALAQALLGADIEILFHGMHQGLHAIGTFPLGCYLHDGNGHGLTPFVETQAGPFPVTLSADLPIALIEPKASFDPARMAAQGRPLDHLTDRQRVWVTDANLIPHGGGTKLAEMTDLQVIDQNGRRVFSGKTAGGVVKFEDPKNLPFGYRGTEVLDQTLALGLGRLTGTMDVTWWIGADQ